MFVKNTQFSGLLTKWNTKRKLSLAGRIFPDGILEEGPNKKAFFFNGVNFRAQEKATKWLYKYQFVFSVPIMAI